MDWVNEVARAVREWRDTLGIEGQATHGDVRRLVEAVEGLEVRWEPGARANLCVWRDRGVIMLDPDLEDEERVRVVLEEVGHWLHRTHPHYTHSRRGLLLSDGKAETPARAFRDLWLLAGVPGALTPEGAAAAGVDPETAQRYAQWILRL